MTYPACLPTQRSLATTLLLQGSGGKEFQPPDLLRPDNQHPWWSCQAARGKTSPVNFRAGKNPAPSVSAASSIASHAFSDDAMGFSIGTWTPARATCRQGCSCNGCGVQMVTASTVAWRRISGTESNARTWNRSANAYARASWKSQTATKSESCSVLSAKACVCPIFPQLMIAVLIFLMHVTPASISLAKACGLLSDCNDASTMRVVGSWRQTPSTIDARQGQTLTRPA